MLLSPLFQKAKDTVLGPTYDLSLALISRRRAQFLNKYYRRKNYPADVLSFLLGGREGEILINKDLKPLKRRLPLFIHGLLHLKGLTHGSKMKRREQVLIASLIDYGKNGRRRNRHRHRVHPRHRRRNIPGK